MNCNLYHYLVCQKKDIVDCCQRLKLECKPIAEKVSVGGKTLITLTNICKEIMKHSFQTPWERHVLMAYFVQSFVLFQPLVNLRLVWLTLTGDKNVRSKISWYWERKDERKEKMWSQNFYQMKQIYTRKISVCTRLHILLKQYWLVLLWSWHFFPEIADWKCVL